MKKPTRDKYSSSFNTRKKSFLTLKPGQQPRNEKVNLKVKKFEKNHHLQEDVFVRVFYIYSLL
jgi:hypothetical protein